MEVFYAIGRKVKAVIQYSGNFAGIGAISNVVVLEIDRNCMVSLT